MELGSKTSKLLEVDRRSQYCNYFIQRETGRQRKTEWHHSQMLDHRRIFHSGNPLPLCDRFCLGLYNSQSNFAIMSKNVLQLRNFSFNISLSIKLFYFINFKIWNSPNKNNSVMNHLCLASSICSMLFPVFIWAILLRIHNIYRKEAITFYVICK